MPRGYWIARADIDDPASYGAALACDRSDTCQAARALRDGAAQMDLVIIEGGE